MKTFLRLFLQSLVFVNFAFASSNPEKNTKAFHNPENSEVFFLENKGQITDVSGKPVPFVLYESSFNGMKIYITEKGLTYVFTKIADDVKARDKSTEKTIAKEETLKSFE